jgi:hypothetical protein
MFRLILHCALWCTVVFCAGAGCSSATEIDTAEHIPQFVEIQLQYGFVDELNTFQGTFTKDLVMDGSVTVTFWLSKADQQAILAKAEELDFFNLPDRMPAPSGVGIQPDPSPDRLRIRTTDEDKTVEWSYPLDPDNASANAIRELSEFIMGIVRQSPVYKTLPDPRGARL